MRLVDQFGRPYTKTRPETREVGVSAIRARWSSYPSRNLTPDTLTRILEEADNGYPYRQAELFEEIAEKDPHIDALLQVRRLAVLGLTQSITPASDDARDADVAAFVEHVLARLNFGDILSDALDGIGQGYSIQEIIWALRDGKYVISAINHIHAKHFVWIDPKLNAPVNIPRILTDAAASYGEELIPFKYFIFRGRGRASLTTRSGVLRRCAWYYLFKNWDIKDWASFIERFVEPLRVGKYGASASDKEKEVLRDALSNLGTDAAAMISDSMLIELVEQQGKKASSDIFLDFLSYLDGSVSKAVLGHTGTVQSTAGKLGGENEAADVRQDILEADATALSYSVQRDIINPLVFFNFGESVTPPEFNLHHEDEDDLEQLLGSLEGLHNIGLPVSLKWTREKFGIPAPLDDKDVLGSSENQQGQGDNGQATARRSHSCPGCGVTSAREGVVNDDRDAIVAEALKRLSMSGLLDPIEKLLHEVDSLQEFRERMLELLKDMPLDDMADVMKDAFTIADLSARDDVQTEASE